MKIQTLLFVFIFTLVGFNVKSQPCSGGEDEVTVTIHTDNFAGEIAWQMVGSVSNVVYYVTGFNTMQNDTTYVHTFCVPAGECLNFTMFDAAGDGISNNPAVVMDVNGTWSHVINGTFGSTVNLEFNCPPGSSCTSAVSISEGNYTAIFDDSWYEFTPTQTGMYEISTCGAPCDTKIWIYESCFGIIVDDTQVGAVYYDDNTCGGLQALIPNATLLPNVTYFIRIGDSGTACSGQDIDWSLTYLGPVTGCMDPTACNYNPLATQDDNSCIYAPDPNCPDQPDLIVLESELLGSIQLTTLNNTDQCMINEGCLTGYGQRDIVRFTTWIENIGEEDYFIGNENNFPGQFTYDNCHGHWHYDGYAEYILFDENGLALPIGFKNGFCVLDLGCNPGYTPFYGCNQMGISAGCYDIYDYYLDCQWIDVTDVEDGAYTFVMRVNWDNAPDANGRYEKETSNNWAQACITLDRTSGSLVMQVEPNCPEFVDCLGEPYGDAQPDCNGVCDGPSLFGDVDSNESQEYIDVFEYITLILGDDISATTCNDLNADGTVSVYDAALLASCLNYGNAHNHPGAGAHDHCDLPMDIENPDEQASLTILSADFNNKTIDIGIKNPLSKIVGYQFQMSGITIASVENLVDPALYPISPSSNIGEAMIIGLSEQDSLIEKSVDFQPLCRINYVDITAEEICIENIVDIVNLDYERIQHQIEGECLFVSSVDFPGERIEVKAMPNPFSSETQLLFDDSEGESFSLEIRDVTGKVVQTKEAVMQSPLMIKRNNLSPGIYYYRLRSDSSYAIGKLLIQ